MDVTTETLSPTRVRLRITVPSADLTAKRRRGLPQDVLAAARARLPPRQGAAPASSTSASAVAAVLDEALQEALPRFYGEAVEQEEVAVLARPEVDVTTFADNEPLVFTADVDVRPEIALPDYSSLTVSVEDADVTDADVDDELAELRNRRGELVEVIREVADGDTITVDLATAVDDEPVEGGTAEGLSYVVGSEGLVPGLDAAVLGATSGTPVTFTTKLVVGELAGQTATVTATVGSIKEKVLPELDDAFATTAGPYATVAELTDAVKENLVRVKRLQQGLSARDKTLEALLELTEVPVPESVVHGEESTPAPTRCRPSSRVTA